MWKKYWKVLLGGLWLSIVVASAVCIVVLETEILIINGRPELLRGIGFFLLGAGVAPLGLFLAYNRTGSLKLQAETEKEKAVTEAFAKSVELLGHQREAVRQGGVYALGRFADNYPDLHPMIMDIVASYIRQEKVNFSDSVLAHCTFNHTDLTESNFVKANLSGSSVIASGFKKARIIQEQLNSLKEVDGKTILPEGLSFPA